MLKDTIRTYPTMLRDTKKAFTINGVYLENVVEGYHTINVSGRESLSSEFSDLSNNIRDGAIFLHKRYPSRVLSVSFIIYLEGNDDPDRELRRKLDQLNGILQITDAKLVFDDEPDRYFIATPGSNVEYAISLGCISGQIEFTCFDPFKYSLERTEVPLTKQTKTVIDVDGRESTFDEYFFETSGVYSNDGSYKTYPSFEVTMPDGDDAKNGYFLFGKDGYSIQAGDPDDDEIGGAGTKKANDKFETGSYSGWSANLQSTYSVSDSGVHGVTRSTTNLTTRYANVGTGGKAQVVTDATKGAGVKFSYTDNNFKQVFSGPFISKQVNLTDEFNIYWDFVFQDYSVENRYATGAMGVYLLQSPSSTTFPQPYASVIFDKDNNSSHKATIFSHMKGDSGFLEMSAFGSVGTFDDYGYSVYTSSDKTPKKARCSITRKKRPVKDSDTYVYYDININIPGIATRHRVEQVAKGSLPTPVHSIGLFFGRCNKSQATKDNFIDARIMNFVAVEGDLIHVLNPGDILDIDTASAMIRINGSEKPELGDISNDWEHMVLNVGYNKVQAQWSDWANIPLSNIKMTYRKRYL